jgi:hypothetical protein
LLTVISTVPDPEGETAVMEPEELMVKLVAAVDPKSTPVAFVKFEPVMLTEALPARGPASGVIELTAGLPTYV